MILNCSEVAKDILSKVKKDVAHLVVKGINPCLLLLRVKGDPASESYVKRKETVCKECGVESITIEFENDVTEQEVLDCIKLANNDNHINAIMLQLPLPKHLKPDILINAIDSKKDVDCLTTNSVGSLFVNNDIVQPCTPKGIMSVLKYHKIDLARKEVLVINRSMLVGKPLLELLQRENATVTLAHSKTDNLINKIANSDIIITAVGKENFIPFELLHDISYNFARNEYKHKHFIDVSINRNKDGKLCGDIEYNNTNDRDKLESLKNVSITPVPTGIGLMTVASLLENTITLTKLQYE